MQYNCLLCGVGGQGTVLASKLIARAAMDEGFPVRTAETIGMAQRGGSVVSHVRFGEGVHSPLIAPGQADVIIGFEPGEAVRALGFLKPGGAVVVACQAVAPVTASLGGGGYDACDMLACLRANVAELTLVDTQSICAQCASPRVLNVALLGAAAGRGILGVGVQSLRAALEGLVRAQFVPLNMQALALGVQAAAQGEYPCK